MFGPSRRLRAVGILYADVGAEGPVATLAVVAADGMAVRGVRRRASTTGGRVGAFVGLGVGHGPNRHASEIRLIQLHGLRLL